MIQFHQQKQKILIFLEKKKKSLSEPIWDLLERGGKRWRPILCILIAEAFGKQLDDIKEICSLCEIVHNGSLIVDDIEDNSLVRRNKECIHLIYGVDISLNAGNFMYFAPFQKLLTSLRYTDKQKLEFAKIYAEEMTLLHVGQGWDILWHNMNKLQGRFPDNNQYLQMTSHKTGCLARLSSRLVCAYLGLNHDQSKALSTFAEKIGVAFQIQDDILNLEGKEYLKTKGQLGEDIHEGKMSLIVIHCLAQSSQENKKRLIEILRMHTNDQDLINEAIQIVKSTDSINYSRQVGAQLVKTAWEEVENIIPEGKPKQLLKLLAEHNIERQV
ncbi:octaprenyl-diphosphate synthase, putative [Ichthyophthirius multifiliis]|uniref:Octaprenyl-diphosphate synthase, putative n=1 Tax=Ichthyophthirius multifiliis TaxID=5932 RepID=G0QXS4_ICHMU|nr:octaprenyl-diphosphate synthase, putative [Ichthyophthirius multifiliis]EGR30011.1 octaprenyl-diphosphate synthase, putative [Ichthyophthirius multifiliis]|eukprot:XP_004031247.1 octaprenyl-diphosphate synthase, putative [Ichthyophthirius multifiliis]